MPRAIWTGTLSFGLVNVPVQLFPATTDKNVHFNQLEAGTSDRIRYRKVNERTGEEVSSDRIVKGYDLGAGEYVILSDEEIDSAEPERSHAINIESFVDLDQINPLYYRASYYLAPQGEPARRAYALLRQAMGSSNKVAVATIVMRNREYLVTVRSDTDALVLETMYFADEVRSAREELPNLPEDETFTTKELATAVMLIDAMGDEFQIDQFHDTHRERLLELIEAKRQGHEVVAVTPIVQATTVVDLMEALKASVSASKQRRAGASTRSSKTEAKPASKSKTAKASLQPVAAKKTAAKATTSTRAVPVAKSTPKRKAS